MGGGATGKKDVRRYDMGIIPHGSRNSCYVRKTEPLEQLFFLTGAEKAVA